MDTPLRKCTVCGLEAYNEKDLDLFVKDKRAKYGHLNKCLACFAEYRRKRRTSYRKYNGERWTERVKRTPEERRIVRHAVAAAQAVPLGDKCEICGRSDKQLVKHHDDYSKPLQIRTLCRRCHYFVHQVAAETGQRFNIAGGYNEEEVLSRSLRES